MIRSAFKFFVGIDVGKSKLALCLLHQDEPRPLARRTVSNDPQGFAQMLLFLLPYSQHSEQIFCTLEATGPYGRLLEQFLHDQSLAYSVVNPARISFFARRQLARTKTDAGDARIIADFGRRHADELPLSVPLTPEQRRLQASMNHRDALVGVRSAEKNRLEACELPDLRKLIQAHIDFLTRQIDRLEAEAMKLVKSQPLLYSQHQLLCTITGIAKRSALGILAQIAGKQFDSARQLAAYAGLTPCQRESGDSVKGKTRLCKTGNSRLRNLLFLPALTARRRCIPLQLWADSLQQRGLAPKAAIGAIMRKLAHIIFGILKHNTPFNPLKLSSQLQITP